MMRRLLLFAFLILAGWRGAATGQAQTLLVDTRHGSTTSTAEVALYNTVSPSAHLFQQLAGRFTIHDSFQITSVEGWLRARTNSTLKVVLYNEIGGLPGNPLRSQTFTLGSASLPVHWEVFSGLTWQLPAGTYWLSFEPPANSTLDAGMVEGVPFPLSGYALFSNSSGNQWISFPATLGFRVSGHSVPAITSPRIAGANVGQSFVYQFVASEATSLGVSNLPAGLVFDPALNAIIGSPTTAGIFHVGLTATNSFGTTNATLALTVQNPPISGPVIASGTAATGRTGSRFRFQVFTRGATSAVRLTATNLPPGLTADAVTGLISGVPTSDGSYAVGLTARDGDAVATGTLQLTFSSDSALPVITSPSDASLSVGHQFSYTIVAPATAGANDPTVFNLVGDLPAGLGFNSATGTISGTLASAETNRSVHTNSSQVIGPNLSGGVITNVQLFATNGAGTTTIPFIFFLRPAGVANISTRLSVGADPKVLIGGFIITGNAPKKVIVRAIAPSLNVGGVPVPGTLPDPTLQLIGPGLSASNDD
ncbi:MAG TPA: Ig domain-containing protein, partial [Chthoniobacterales bacterium]|nr:Ig domain-containing protein [Chthoniobacterales bacterium]